MSSNTTSGAPSKEGVKQQQKPTPASPDQRPPPLQLPSSPPVAVPPRLVEESPSAGRSPRSSTGSSAGGSGGFWDLQRSLSAVEPVTRYTTTVERPSSGSGFVDGLPGTVYWDLSTTAPATTGIRYRLSSTSFAWWRHVEYLRISAA